MHANGSINLVVITCVAHAFTRRSCTSTWNYDSKLEKRFNLWAQGLTILEPESMTTRSPPVSHCQRPYFVKLSARLDWSFWESQATCTTSSEGRTIAGMNRTFLNFGLGARFACFVIDASLDRWIQRYLTSITATKPSRAQSGWSTLDNHSLNRRDAAGVLQMISQSNSDADGILRYSALTAQALLRLSSDMVRFCARGCLIRKNFQLLSGSKHTIPTSYVHSSNSEQTRTFVSAKYEAFLLAYDSDLSLKAYQNMYRLQLQQGHRRRCIADPSAGGCADKQTCAWLYQTARLFGWTWQLNTITRSKLLILAICNTAHTKSCRHTRPVERSGLKAHNWDGPHSQHWKRRRFRNNRRMSWRLSRGIRNECPCQWFSLSVPALSRPNVHSDLSPLIPDNDQTDTNGDPLTPHWQVTVGVESAIGSWM